MKNTLTPPLDLLDRPKTVDVSPPIAVTNQTEETRFFCASMLADETLEQLYRQYVADRNMPQLIASLHRLLNRLPIQRTRFDVWAAQHAVMHFGQSQQV